MPIGAASMHKPIHITAEIDYWFCNMQFNLLNKLVANKTAINYWHEQNRKESVNERIQYAKRKKNKFKVECLRIASTFIIWSRRQQHIGVHELKKEENETNSAKSCALCVCVIQLIQCAARLACIQSWYDLSVCWAAHLCTRWKRFKSLSRVLAHARKGYSILTNRIYVGKWGREKRRTNKLNGTYGKMLVKSTRQKRKECVRWGTNGRLNKLNSMVALLKYDTPIHNKQSKNNAYNSNKSTTIAKSLSNKTPATTNSVQACWHGRARLIWC